MIRYLVLLGVFVPVLVLADAGSDFVADHGDFFRLLQPEQLDLEVGYLYQPDTEQDNGPGEFELQQFLGVLELPLPIDNDLYYRLGGQYQASQFEFDEVSSASTRTSGETFHKIVGIFGAGVFLTPDFLITGAARPGIYSDFNGDVDENDFQLHGDGLLVYRINPTAQLVAGVLVSEDFDKTPILPIAGLRLLSENGKVHVNLTAPLELRVAYNFTPSSSLYGGFWISGDEYSVELGPQDLDFRIHAQYRRVGLGAMVWFTNHLNLTVEGGLNVGSELDFKVENAGQFADGDLKEVGYIALRVGIAL